MINTTAAAATKAPAAAGGARTNKRKTAAKRRRQQKAALAALEAASHAASRGELESSAADRSVAAVGPDGSPVNRKTPAAAGSPGTSPAGLLQNRSLPRKAPVSRRLVSPDLPFNLITGDPAGSAPSPASNSGTMDTISLLKQAKEAHDYEEVEKLKAILAVELHEVGIALPEDSESPSDLHDPNEPLVTEEGAALQSDGELEDGMLEGDRDLPEKEAVVPNKDDEPIHPKVVENDPHVILEKLTALRKIDKFVIEGLPDFDLDSQHAVGFAFDELEAKVYGTGINLDRFVPRLLPLLVQKSVQANAEKVRVHSVSMQFHSHKQRGETMDYATFRRACQHVSAGETPRYNRRTWRALSMQSCGSFDKYLAEFETQASYVQPSFREKIETFQEGLTHSLRNRVLLHPSGDDWNDWNVFLKFAHRFADAELISRNLPRVADKTTGTASAQPTKQTTQVDKGKGKATAKRTLAKPTQPTGKKPATTNARWELIKKICRDESRCTTCLQPAHGGGDCERRDAEAVLPNFASRLQAYRAKNGASSAKPAANKQSV